MNVRGACPWLVLLAVALGSGSTASADKPARPFPVGPSRFPAQQPTPVTVTCEFVEVWGASPPGGKGQIDPALPKTLGGKLAKVKQWTDYKQLSTTTKTLEQKKDEKLKLSKGSAVVSFIEIVDKSKVRLSIDFESAKGKATQKQLVAAGDWVTTAVQQPNGDGHLLAGSCK